MVCDYITYALNKEKDQAVWELWSRSYPLMEAGLIKYENFEDFKAAVFKPRLALTNKTPEQIEQEMVEVIAAYKKGR